MSRDGVMVGKRFRVVPEARLTHLDSPGCQAFAAEDAEGGPKSYFALVCGPERPPRQDLFSSMMRAERPPWLKLQAWTIADWPMIGKERFLLVFEEPGGERLMPSPEARIAPMREEEILRRVLQPLIPAFEDLNNRAIAHRAVRADNLFFKGMADSEVVLGECLSAPPGYYQPLIYETLENGMATPSGRGTGSTSEDLYALGVLLCVLLTGGNPCDGMGDREIIASKIDRGSYATLAGKIRASLALMEPLRGMLNDDPAGRWGVTQLLSWLDGRKLTPQQSTLPEKAARAFEFGGTPHTNLRSLAYAMASDWDEAVKTIKRDNLAQWISRSLPNKEKADALHGRLVYAQSTRRRASDDETLSSVLIAFDPLAPVRFRDFGANPEALGQALAVDFEKSDTVKTFERLIEARLPNFWLEAQPATRPEFVSLKRMLELSAQLLKRDCWGFGVERCLYELNPEWPCRSPLLDKYIVSDVRRLLPVLEQIASQGPPEREPVDPHIAAFCAAQLKKLPDRALTMLGNSDDIVQHRIGMLRLLASVQYLVGPKRLPALTRWLARLLSPIIESFHHRPYRQSLAEEIQSAAEYGDLAYLLALVDNSEAKQADDIGYSKARSRYAQAVKEIKWLEEGGLTHPAQVARGSGQAGVLLSAILSGMTLVLLTVLYVS